MTEISFRSHGPREDPNLGSQDCILERSPRSKKGCWRGWLAAALLLLTGCRETILHDLSEDDANRVLTRLAQHQVEAKKKIQPDGTWSVTVPSDQALAALGNLEHQQVTRNGQNRSRQSSSFLPSRENERFEYERAVSSEIEATLKNLAGVLQARVHLNIPNSDPLLSAAAPKSSAAVLLLVHPETSINEGDVAGIVAGASGVSIGSISVVVSVKTIPPETLSSPAERSVGNTSGFSGTIQKGLAAVSACSFAAFLGFVLVRRRRMKRLDLIATRYG